MPLPTPPSSPHPRRLREAHAHIASYGQALELPSLEACRSLADCLERVKRAAEKARRDGSAPGRPFLRFSSARVEAWADARWPTLAELDRAAGDLPCVIMSFDHHNAAANSAALAAAGLRAGAVVPPHGLVEADAHGHATGRLTEDAAFAAWGAAPEPSPQIRKRQVAAALAALAQLGYVEVHDLQSQPWLGPLLAELERENALPLTVRLFPPLDAIEREGAARTSWESDRLRLGGAKLFADGTLNSRTAFMLHRYHRPEPGHPRGRCLVEPEGRGAMAAAVTRCDALGLPLAVHAIGDAAVRLTLDAIEHVRPRTRGYRIEHCELLDAADVPRFAKLGVIASVQPCHLLADVEALRRYLPHRLGRVLPLRELIDAGCKPGELLLFGSDVPIVGADPRDSIQAAVYRRRVGDPPGSAIAADQAITEAQAWACFEMPA